MVSPIEIADDRDVVDELATARGPDFDGHRGAAATATATSAARRAGRRRAAR